MGRDALLTMCGLDEPWRLQINEKQLMEEVEMITVMAELESVCRRHKFSKVLFAVRDYYYLY
jgi:hypothetical protein